VANYKNGVGFGAWTHIDVWSEPVIEYVRELESNVTVDYFEVMGSPLSLSSCFQ
jgi:hypothetical protein